MCKYLKLLFFLAGIFTNLVYKTYAQDFEVSPVKLSFSAEPGQTQSFPISITNHSNAKTGFVLLISDYIVNKQGDKIEMPAASTEHSLANWISINPPFLEINPNETRQVLISIQAPAGDFSTKWANIYVRTSKEQTASLADKTLQTGLIIGGQIIVRTLQSPKTNVNYRLKIGSLTELMMVDGDQKFFSAVIDNLGDKISYCKVYFIASNLITAEEIKLDEISFESYPDSQLEIKLKLNKKLAPGKYQLAAILDYGSKSNLEGTQLLYEVTE